METSHPAGWLPDPLGRYQYRYWSGAEWTDRVSTNGSSETDPHGLAPSPATLAPAPSPVPAAAPRASNARLRWSTDIQVLVFGGAAALVVGAFLPWVKAEAGLFSFTKNGIDGDGVLTLGLAVAIGLVFVLTKAPKPTAWLVLALGGVATAIAGYDTADVSNKADELTSQSSVIHISASVGIGLWLSLVGAVLVVIGGILALTRGPTDDEGAGT